MRAKLTHGEYIFERRENLDFTHAIEKMYGANFKRIPPRMKREEAVKYYGAKLKQVWES